MPYFLILPAFAIWLVLAATAVVACWAIAPLRPLLGCVWRIAFWASAGLIGANLLVLGAGLLELRLSNAAPGLLRQGTALLATATLFAGPFFASAVGWFAGAILGAVLAVRAHRKPPNKSFKPNPLRGSA